MKENSGCVYGYSRISRRTQNIERQERNIRAAYPTALVIREVYTGTKIDGRKGLDHLVRHVKKGDMIVFDSASRMSRNAEEAMQLYEEMFSRGVELVFLKEPHINTAIYRKAIESQVELSYNTGNAATDGLISDILQALNTYTIALAREQIRIVFEQAQKEVDDLHQRTAEGILTARLAGKQIGQKPGAKLTTKKSIDAKKQIRKYSKAFDGSLNDLDTIKMVGIARNTYYKYKREMLQKMDAEYGESVLIDAKEKDFVSIMRHL